MPIYCANQQQHQTTNSNNNNGNNNGRTMPIAAPSATTAPTTTGSTKCNILHNHIHNNNNNNGHHYSATINNTTTHNYSKKHSTMIINNNNNNECSIVCNGSNVSAAAAGGGSILNNSYFMNNNNHNNHHNLPIHPNNNIHFNHSSTNPTCSPIFHQLSSANHQQQPSTSSSSQVMASHHHHHHHHIPNCNNLKQKANSSSLIMAINRFKNSVKDMKETVLIPTRLSDLTTNTTNNIHSATSKQDDVIYYENNSLVDIHEEEDDDSDSQQPASSYLSPEQTLKYGDHNGETANQHFNSKSSLSASLSPNQNLYEQFKLLDLIDKILSSDTILTVSIRPNNGLSYLEHNDSNNNPRRRMFRLENGKLQHQQQIDEDGESYQQQTINMINGKHKLNRQASTSSSGSGSYRSNSPDSAILDHQNYYFEAGRAQANGIVSDCSLLKIKEKLEYHLISLKSILNMMSDGAEYITRTYLEDIQSGEDRFDQTKRSGINSNCDQPEQIIPTRHYYTSN